MPLNSVISEFLRADEDILFRTPKVGAVSAKWVPFSVRLYFPLTKQSWAPGKEPKVASASLFKRGGGLHRRDAINSSNQFVGWVNKINHRGSFRFHLELPSHQQNCLCILRRRKLGVCGWSGQDHIEVLQNSPKTGVEVAQKWFGPKLSMYRDERGVAVLSVIRQGPWQRDSPQQLCRTKQIGDSQNKPLQWPMQMSSLITREALWADSTWPKRVTHLFYKVKRGPWFLSLWPHGKSRSCG